MSGDRIWLGTTVLSENKNCAESNSNLEREQTMKTAKKMKFTFIDPPAKGEQNCTVSIYNL